MKILFLTSESFPTFRADVAILFGKYLPEFGIYTDVVTNKAADAKKPFGWGGGQALLCESAGFVVLKHFRKLMHCVGSVLHADKQHYQAVQVRDMPFIAAFCLLVAKVRRLPFYYWMSYPIPEGQMARAVSRGLGAKYGLNLLLWLRGKIGQLVLRKIVLPWADHVFVQSEQMKKEALDSGLRSERVTPVPMGVDIDAMRSSGLTPHPDARLLGRKVITYLGTLDQPRHIDLLFDMLSLVREKYGDVILVLVGDTKDDRHRAWLKNRARDAGLENEVIWTGWVPMSEGWSYVLGAHVALSPFPRGVLLDSASPTKVPEYLALGIPVVCNDNPDQQEVITQSGAGVCVPYQARDFADAVIALLEEPEQQRQERISRGLRYVDAVRHYRVIAEKVANCYRDLTN